MNRSLRPLFVSLLSIGVMSLSVLAQPARPAQPAAQARAGSPGDQDRGPGARSGAANDTSPTLPEAWTDQMRWRPIGPANMSGRISAIAVYEADPSIYWVASASGGLLKTTNNGVTFEHQFDREATVSIGDVQVCQSDPNIVWVGTGEHNPRNSVSWGNGVYKSTDGGATWKHMGLDKTFQIGRIQLHPDDPNTVYVGAAGRLWGENEDRGLYKTTDGGETWEKVLYIDERTGIIDVKLMPGDPYTVLAAAYERQRDGFDGNDPAKKNGPGGGLHRSTDGGVTWTKVTDGLPSGAIGRIGIDWYRKDPNLVYMVLESEKTGRQPDNSPFAGLTGENADVGARLTQIENEGPAAKAGLKSGDIVIGIEGKTVQSWEDLQAAIRRHQAGDTVAVEVSRNRESVKLEITFDKLPGAEEDEETESDDEAAQQARRRQNRSPFDGGLGGQRENMTDQQGSDGHEYGGVYRSDNAGVTWQRINSVNPRPMYYSEIRVDPGDNNHIWVLGTSLYKSSDGGATFSADGARGGVHVDHHAMWVDHRDGRHVLLGNDGGHYVTYDRGERWEHLNKFAVGQFYHVALGPQRNYRVYGGLQDNGSWGGPSRLGSGGPLNADWFNVGGGDGFICRVDPDDPDQIYSESQNGSMGRYNLRTGERGSIRPRPERGVRYRFNWKTPFILSSHNSEIHYSAGNYVFRSIKKGDAIQVISPEITRTDDGAGSAISESPADENVLYVGTTDGALWGTRDGGKTWIDLFNAPAGELAAADRQGAPAGRAGAGGPGGGRRGGGAGGPGGQGGQGGAQFRQRLMESDANGDGNIQKDEVPERMQGMFDRMDGNADGVLDEQELSAAAQGRGGNRGGQGAAPSEAPVETAPQQATEATEATTPQVAQDAAPQQSVPEAAEQPAQEAAPAAPAAPPAPAGAEVVNGRWSARMINENFSGDQNQATLTLRMGADGTITGTIRTFFSEGDIHDGKFDAATGALTFAADTGQMGLTFAGSIQDDRMTGTINVGEGMFSMGLEATKSGDDAGGPATRAVPTGVPLKSLMPGDTWVSAIEASRFEAGRVYVTFDGHRSNLDDPFVFASEDYGRTWRSLRANLPAMAGSTRVIREDLYNPNLLYLGCEFSCWVSVDRGESWTKLNSNLPTVAVHEFAIHPTAGEIVAATHGRSLWVLDVTALRQMSTATINAPAYLFRPADGVIWQSAPRRGNSGLESFEGQNPPDGTQIFYSIGARQADVELEIQDARGRKVITLEAPGEQGLHRVDWDLRRAPQAAPAQAGRGGGFGGGGGGGRGRFGRRGPLVEPGAYIVVLTVNGETHKQVVTVMTDPDNPAMDVAQINRQEFLEDLEEAMGEGEED